MKRYQYYFVRLQGLPFFLPSERKRVYGPRAFHLPRYQVAGYVSSYIARPIISCTCHCLQSVDELQCDAMIPARSPVKSRRG